MRSEHFFVRGRFGLWFRQSAVIASRQENKDTGIERKVRLSRFPVKVQGRLYLGKASPWPSANSYAKKESFRDSREKSAADMRSRELFTLALTSYIDLYVLGSFVL